MAGNLVPRSDNTTSIGTIIKRYIKGFFYGLDVKSGVNAPIKTLQRSTAYVIGDVVTTDALHAKYYLKCTTAGTTGSSEPSFTGAMSNSTVTDGTAVWTVQTITSAEEVSSSVANTYAPKASPAFTGNPTAPTQVATDDSTKIATTAYVKDNLENYAPLNNPALTGNPTAPTQVASDSSTKVATTAFVHGHTDDKAPLASPALTGTPTAPTQPSTDNSTKLATTEFVTTKAGNYLPLTGGTMSGNINSSASSFRISSLATNDSGNVAIFGGSAGDKGAYAQLFGINNSGAGGNFLLVATDGTNTKQLLGKPNGTLTWGGKEVERVYASASGYIRYESGLQICWGSFTGSGNDTGTTVTFPVAFTNVIVVLGSPNAITKSTNHVTIQTGTVSRTGCIFYASTGTTWIDSTVVAGRYIAIGKWK